MTAPLQTRDLHFTYPSAAAPTLASIHLALHPGELLCVLGPNGCGKTTLLKLFLGELSPASGTVLLDGEPLAQTPLADRAKQIAYVPQTPPASLDRSVFDVVLTGRLPYTGMMGLTSAADIDIATAALEQVHMSEMSWRNFDTLSGGEAQRVMIARALAQQPRILLLDEPTASLDIRHQYQIFDLLRTLCETQDLAIAAVAHDIHLAARFAHRACLLAHSAIDTDGPPSEVLTPETLHRVYGVSAKVLPAPTPTFHITGW
ncbi:MAG: ABC transporter ATP-binding protein [Phycisphaerales bacterium]|mgnify:CR=1 FL=1|jgi:iron complex transport system ATP-binding protein|nr:ABC transporter ATP-binding protein [Phycisphaerales bacterium]MBT7171391.1 ABC transporter ATP-binding protein [Phycisphaerales bacterium]